MNSKTRKKIDLSCMRRKDWCDFIDECVLGNNAERDREIVKRALLDGLTNERIAEEQAMSRAQVQRIVSARIEELYLILRKDMKPNK